MPGLLMWAGPQIAEDEALVVMRQAGPAALTAALARDRLTFDDFLALLSPLAAASPWREQIRLRAQRERLRHFGRTVRLYTPIYLSNACVNACRYCGFRVGRGEPRRRLSLMEIRAEAAVVRGFGIGSLLLVCGEDPEGMPLARLVEAARELRQDFPFLAVEIYPQNEGGYRELFAAGVHGVTLYQETYDRQLYAELHPHGPKRDYDARLAAIACAARAGMFVIGIGALLGLRDWRREAVALAEHGRWLRKHYWRSRLQFSFPRLTPVPDFTPPAELDDAELETMVLAFRCFFPEADIAISTREAPARRDHLAKFAASHLSAGSRVSPGAYTAAACIAGEQAIGQFTLNDERPVAMLCRDLVALGLQPVRKDWDATLGMAELPETMSQPALASTGSPRTSAEPIATVARN